MTDCVNCKCSDVVVGKTACKSLKAQNNDVIKQHALVLRDTKFCGIIEEVPKFAYSQWCFNKNIIEQLCWITQNMVDGSVLKEIENLKSQIEELHERINFPVQPPK